MTATDGPDDATLVARATGGDRDALETLLRRHHDRIHLLCRRLCRDPGDADDATQDALVAIVRGLGRFDGRAAFTTWSHRVAANACMDELRRRRRRPEPHDAPTGGELARDGHSPGPSGDRAPDPAEMTVAAETSRTVQQALDALPDEFRAPVVLRDVAGLDYAEIAELLGLAPGTVRSRISRGRSRLAVLLEDLAPPTGSDRAGNPVRSADVGDPGAP